MQDQATTAATIDVRAIAPRELHPSIFLAFGKLAAGQAMDLVNDHDPRPLYYQFQEELPGQFTWSYLENGPAQWRVRIQKQRAPGHGSGQCCGACGGA